MKQKWGNETPEDPGLYHQKSVLSIEARPVAGEQREANGGGGEGLGAVVGGEGMRVIWEPQRVLKVPLFL